MPHSEPALDFRVPADPLFSRVVRENTTKFALSHGIDDDDLAQFMTALGEAVANAIEHAKSDEPIEVALRFGGDRLIGRVRDAGVGFRGEVGLSSVVLPAGDAERGRGLAIMRRCSDIMAVDSAPGKGTDIVIGRFLRDRATAEHVA